MEEHNSAKPPRQQNNNDIVEQRLGQALSTIRERMVKPYLRLENEEEKIKFEDEYPEIKEIMKIISWIDSENLPPYLINAQDIKGWIEQHGRKPSGASKDEQEKKLGRALTEIRRNLIKVYNELETEEEKRNFKIQHPEIDEVIKIIAEIDENSVPPLLLNARRIKQWMEQKETTKSPTANSKDDEEARLGRALSNMKLSLIKPYMGLETEEEREEFEKQHPEIKEIMQIVSWIDENNISPYLVNARSIKEWVEAQGKPKLPRRSRNIEGIEKELGNKLSYIRQDLIKPYMSLETEEEREKFIERNPDTEEVIEIITALDMQCGNAKQQELAILIRQDLEKRRMIREARQLEASYESQLAKQTGIDTQENLKGVSLDEQ